MRPAKKLQAAIKESEPSLSLREATALLRNKDIWEDVAYAFTKAPDLNEDDKKLVVAAITTRLAYRSWQRPGAVTNARLEEFQATKKVTDPDGGEDVYVMKIVRHKTAREGPANITMSKEERRLVQKYVVKVRPLCDPYYREENLFLNVNGKPITNLAMLTRWLGKRYNITLPTFTELRQVGATAAGLQLSPGRAKLLAAQMCHSDAVHTKHYEKIRSVTQAAKAHRLRDKLCQPTRSESEESSSNSSDKLQHKEHKALPFSDDTSQQVSSEYSSSEQPGHQYEPKSKRVRYSVRELDAISHFFKRNIRHGSIPATADVEYFLREHTYIDRTVKKIKDKVRQLSNKK